jgi:hypothetical protein
MRSPRLDRRACETSAITALKSIVGMLANGACELGRSRALPLSEEA